MSDHVDGDAPALARDAAGVRLDDLSAVTLAAKAAEDVGSLCIAEWEALAAYVRAVAPVVAAARAALPMLGSAEAIVRRLEVNDHGIGVTFDAAAVMIGDAYSAIYRAVRAPDGAE